MIYDNKTFVERNDKTKYSAYKILGIIKQMVDIKSAIDVGCGVGTFLKELQVMNGLDDKDITGLDGDYVDKNLLVISEESFIPCNLEDRILIKRKYDLVISLEVAEHLSVERAKSFVEDLTLLGDNVLFSAAIPYQGGLGHINEQYLSYWNKIFNSLGYSLCDCVRPIIWDDENIPWHYRQNTVLFTRGRVDNICKENMVIDMVHPKFWENKNERIKGIESNMLYKIYRRLWK